MAQRNMALRWVQENDPARWRSRTVKPSKGKGRKVRPRKSNWTRRIEGD